MPIVHFVEEAIPPFILQQSYQAPNDIFSYWLKTRNPKGVLVRVQCSLKDSLQLQVQLTNANHDQGSLTFFNLTPLNVTNTTLDYFDVVLSYGQELNFRCAGTSATIIYLFVITILPIELARFVQINAGVYANILTSAGAIINPAKEDGNLALVKAKTDNLDIALSVLRDALKATSLGDNRKTVTTAGTAVALAASTACQWVIITAETDNTDKVVVGGSTVVAALATRRGVPLDPGDSVVIPVDNLADVYIDSLVSGEGVTFTYGV